MAPGLRGARPARRAWKSLSSSGMRPKHDGRLRRGAGAAVDDPGVVLRAVTGTTADTATGAAVRGAVAGTAAAGNVPVAGVVTVSSAAVGAEAGAEAGVTRQGGSTPEGVQMQGKGAQAARDRNFLLGRLWLAVVADRHEVLLARLAHRDHELDVGRNQDLRSTGQLAAGRVSARGLTAESATWQQGRWQRGW